jgi:hypothetical protein
MGQVALQPEALALVVGVEDEAAGVAPLSDMVRRMGSDHAGQTSHKRGSANNEWSSQESVPSVPMFPVQL